MRRLQGSEASRVAGERRAHHLDLKVWLACEDLHLEIPIHIVDHVEFVDHSAQGLVFLRGSGGQDVINSGLFEKGVQPGSRRG